jgi:hypothetical protein
MPEHSPLPSSKRQSQQSVREIFLTIADVRSTLKNFPRITTLLATMALLSSAATVVSAQTERSPAILTNSTDAMLSLPDAPSFTTSSSAALDDTAGSSVTSDISSPSDADAAATETTEHRSRPVATSPFNPDKPPHPSLSPGRSLSGSKNPSPSSPWPDGSRPPDTAN